MGPDAMIFVFWILSFKPTFSLYSFTFIKRLFSSSSLSSIAYLRLLIFLWAILIPACTPSFFKYLLQPTPVFLPGESQGQRSLVGCCLWGRKESDMTEQLNRTELKVGLTSASFLPMNTQDWSSLGWTGWISLQSKDSQESSPTPQFKILNSSMLNLLHSPTLTSIHDHRKNHSLD